MNTGVRPSARDHYARFGTIAVELGFISVDELFKAMKIQLDDDVKGRVHRQIGTILYEMDAMTSEQVDQVMKELLRTRRVA